MEPFEPPRYRMYVDETGNHHVTEKGINAEQHLALSAVIVDCAKYDSVVIPALSGFVRSVFGTDPDDRIVLHREDILARTGPFEALRDAGIRDRFNRGLCGVLADLPMCIVCVVLDKKGHVDRYGESAKHPYHYCAEALIERYSMFLHGCGGVGDVMAERRNPDADKEFNDAWRSFYEGGTAHLDKYYISDRLTSHDIKFRDKKHGVHGLQVADVIAVAAKYDVLIDRSKKDCHGNSFDRWASHAIAKKYRRSNGGRIRGWGWVLLSGW